MGGGGDENVFPSCVYKTRRGGGTRNATHVGEAGRPKNLIAPKGNAHKSLCVCLFLVPDILQRKGGDRLNF